MLNRYVDPLVAWVRDFHDHYARVILAGIAAMVVPLSVLTAVATLDNWRQDARDRELLACFNVFAEVQSSSSDAVREASVKKDLAAAARDEAEAARDDALNAEGLAFRNLTSAIRKSFAGKPVSPELSRQLFEELDETLAQRHRAARKLDRKQERYAVAQAALDRARRDNPVPDPPSEFCASGDGPTAAGSAWPKRIGR